MQTAAPENLNLKPVIAAHHGNLNDRGDAWGATPSPVAKATDGWDAQPHGKLERCRPLRSAVLEGEVVEIGADASDLQVRPRTCADDAVGSA